VWWWKNFSFTLHKFLLVTVKELLKSVLTYRSYPQKNWVSVFFDRPVVSVARYSMYGPPLLGSVGLIEMFLSNRRRNCRRCLPISFVHSLVTLQLSNDDAFRTLALNCMQLSTQCHFHAFVPFTNAFFSQSDVAMRCWLLFNLQRCTPLCNTVLFHSVYGMTMMSFYLYDSCIVAIL